ncbi:hypothetical protein ACFWJY_00750 [Streptomyces anulatus]|uniref:hypothetical protein n=1 Tax=Streptomyces anulatus TaxID=1892 RepID=UPI0036571EB7
MSTTTTDSPTRIRHIYDGNAGLYADSLVTEAAALLDAYLAAAEQHGLDRNAVDGDGWLAQGAAETIARKYSRPAAERTSAELSQLVRDLNAALTAEGLEVVPTQIRMGTGVAPLPGGPTWGMNGGLTVALYSDSGWRLMVNAPRTTVHTINAPDSADGIREVAQLVHGVLRGDIRDPFRLNR